MGQVHVIDHPLIQHKITLIRDKNTGPKDFRDLVGEVAMLMAYEVTRNLPLETVDVETPIGQAVGRQLAGKKVGVIAILLPAGMVDAVPVDSLLPLGTSAFTAILIRSARWNTTVSFRRMCRNES